MPATIAAAAPPPPASTAVAANWAEPANSSADITIGTTGPITGSARTPNEIASSNEATAYGMPIRIPLRNRLRASVSPPSRYTARHCGGPCVPRLFGWLNRLEGPVQRPGAVSEAGGVADGEAGLPERRLAPSGPVARSLGGVEAQARDHRVHVA